MKLPSHQQTLYSHTIEEDEKSRSHTAHQQYQGVGDQSSLSDASSLGDTSQQRFDSMLIEKHNQV